MIELFIFPQIDVNTIVKLYSKFYI